VCGVSPGRGMVSPSVRTPRAVCTNMSSTVVGGADISDIETVGNRRLRPAHGSLPAAHPARIGRHSRHPLRVIAWRLRWLSQRQFAFLHGSGRELQGRQDVSPFQVRIVGENFLDTAPRDQPPQNSAHRYPGVLGYRAGQSRDSG
jgi:hypothetical protein